MSDLTETKVLTDVTDYDDEERLYTAEEMAAFLGMKVGSLKDWTKLKENPCPCLRFKSRTLRFQKDEVMKWFKAQTKVWRESST